MAVQDPMIANFRKTPRLVQNQSSHEAPSSQALSARAEAPATVGFDLAQIGTIAADLATALTAAEWERLKSSNDVARLMRFAAHFPGYYGELARQRAFGLEQEQREYSNWLWAEETGTLEAYLRYLEAWPNGRHSEAARRRADSMRRPSQSGAPLSGRRDDLSLDGVLARTEYDISRHRLPDLAQASTGRPLSFRDIPEAPEMVVVPSGTFLMGGSDEDARSFELPVRRVTIPSKFAVSRYAVTFDEWSNAVKAGVLKYEPADAGWGRGRRPVINVSWHDARLYVAWLSQATGYVYRLLSEAEWEYCCRAGTTSAYATGAEIDESAARFSIEEWGSAKCTLEVGSHPANAFGLFDMHGNVAEWVEDDWIASYGEAGVDGAPVKSDRPQGKIVRGGGWPDLMPSLRSASRNRLNPTTRNNSTGFRVARALPGAG